VRADGLRRAGPRRRLYAEAAPLLDRPWPAGATWAEDTWPAPYGLRLDRLGPDDGTAVGAVLRCAEVRVRDGGDELTLAVEAPGGTPFSVALWRNLGGWPVERPYRSIGVEPMLGAVFDLAEAGPADAAVVPAGGELAWRLLLAVSRSSDGSG
jgi:hypothetical protein